MAKVYKIEIEETLQKVVEIQASSLDEAIRQKNKKEWER